LEKIKYPIKEFDIKQIKSNKYLAVNVRDEEVNSIEKTIRRYGLITPVVIMENKDGEKITVCGEAEIQALKNMGISKTDVIVSELKSKEDAGRITLIMSGMNKGLCPITEGLILKEMLNTGGFTQKELAFKLQKSQSWISKRLTLAHCLKDSVIQMVLSKKMAPKSAEEIAKLPSDNQHEFAIQAVKLNLTKANIEKLVSTYRNDATSQSLKEEIVMNPRAALTRICSDFEIKKIRKSITKNQRLDSTMRLLLKLIGEMEGYMATINKDTFERFHPLFGAVNTAIKHLSILINDIHRMYDKNSPGNNIPIEKEG
jgi:ParB/RepB/Spo0J family partition protein